jgi:hypothetical protein
MPPRLTAAARAKANRQRLKANEEQYEEYKQKRKVYYAKNKKPINEQTPREQRKSRKQWKLNQRNRRMRLAASKNLETPPASPEDAALQQNVQIQMILQEGVERSSHSLP